MLTKVTSQSDPETFRTMIFDRDISYIRNFWDSKDQTKSGFLSRDEALEVLHSVIQMHWKDEIAGLSESEKDHFIVTFCNLADKEGDEMISLDNLISAFKTYTSRCYFSGSEEILLNNNIGRELKASTKDNLEDHCMRHSITSEFDYQLLLDKFLSIDGGHSCAVPLSGSLALFTPGYKMVDDISVSPYQSLMFPLKHQKIGSHRRRRYSNASGFRCVAS